MSYLMTLVNRGIIKELEIQLNDRQSEIEQLQEEK